MKLTIDPKLPMPIFPCVNQHCTRQHKDANGNLLPVGYFPFTGGKRRKFCSDACRKKVERAAQEQLNK